MEVWTQVYNPLGTLWLSALVAALPIAFFFVTLAVLRWEGYLAGLGTIVVTVIVALTVYGMPAGLALRATANGMAFGLWPISWIILNAVFLYKLSVKSGTVRDHPRLGCVDHQGPATAGHSYRFCLRRLPWKARRASARPVAITAAILAALGTQSTLRRRPVPDRQHGAGRLRRARHPHSRRRQDGRD